MTIQRRRFLLLLCIASSFALPARPAPNAGTQGLGRVELSRCDRSGISLYPKSSEGYPDGVFEVGARVLVSASDVGDCFDYYWTDINGVIVAQGEDIAIFIEPFVNHLVLIAPGCGCGDADFKHSIDTNQNWHVELSELMRIIQIYNSNGYFGVANSEDGFSIREGTHSCYPHSADYAPQDWKISLNEVLRVIQFYNSRTYHPCDEGEDGFCAGT